MSNEFEEHWISTLLVPKFYFLRPKAEDIYIEDIAHALSLICRFGGHGDRFYSVAEHSVIMSRILERTGADALTILAGLLHDAEEAYLPDIPSPIKVLMPEAKAIYESLNGAIVSKFSLEQANWRLISDVDHRLVITEALLLKIWNPDWLYQGAYLEAKVYCWSPRKAEREFLKAYDYWRIKWLRQQFQETKSLLQNLKEIRRVGFSSPVTQT